MEDIILNKIQIRTNLNDPPLYLGLRLVYPKASGILNDFVHPSAISKTDQVFPHLPQRFSPLILFATTSDRNRCCLAYISENRRQSPNVSTNSHATTKFTVEFRGDQIRNDERVKSPTASSECPSLGTYQDPFQITQFFPVALIREYWAFVFLQRGKYRTLGMEINQGMISKIYDGVNL